MKKLSTKIITILALCIALNIVGSNIALLLKLPIYLDTIGTILAASLAGPVDRKSTRLNSSHVSISYAVFCWKKKRWSVETVVRCRHSQPRRGRTTLSHRASQESKAVALFVCGEPWLGVGAVHRLHIHPNGRI